MPVKNKKVYLRIPTFKKNFEVELEGYEMEIQRRKLDAQYEWESAEYHLNKTKRSNNIYEYEAFQI